MLLYIIAFLVFMIVRYNLMTPGRETDEDIIEIEEEEYNITLENTRL